MRYGTPTPWGRFHELDSLRAFAALGVVGWHYTNHFKAAPLTDLMLPFYRHGLLLVDFFFVLSGFVLAHAFWREERRTRLTGNLLARIGRLYPLHLVTLLLVAGLQWVLTGPLGNPPFIYRFNDAYDFLLNAVLLNRTGLERGFSFNAPSWSISTEFLVNLLFLGAIALPRRCGPACLGALFALSLAAVMKNGLVADLRFGGIDQDIFRTIFGFLIGVGTQRLHRRIVIGSGPPGWLMDVVALSAMALFLLYCARGTLSPAGDAASTALLFPALILAVLRSRRIKSVLTLKPLTYLGEISLSIYLIHFPLQLIVHIAQVKTGITPPFDNAGTLAVFLSACIGAAAITHSLIECPGRKLAAALAHPLDGAASTSDST